MKSFFIAFALVANSAFSQTNSIIFPQLLSATNSVLMTNAEFRVISGTRVIFNANNAYQSFEASNLNEQVLNRLGVTISQLESNKAVLIAKQQTAIAAQAAYQKQLAALVGTNREIQILSVNANYGMMKCTAVVGGEKRELLVNNLPASVIESLNKYNQLKSEVSNSEMLYRDSLKASQNARQNSGEESMTASDMDSTRNYVLANVGKGVKSRMLMEKAEANYSDNEKLKQLLEDSTKKIQEQTTITAFPTGKSYASLPLWQCVSKP